MEKVNYNEFLLNIIKDAFQGFTEKNANDRLFNTVAYVALNCYRKGVEDGRASKNGILNNERR